MTRRDVIAFVESELKRPPRLRGARLAGTGEEHGMFWLFTEDILVEAFGSVDAAERWLKARKLLLGRPDDPKIKAYLVKPWTS